MESNILTNIDDKVDGTDIRNVVNGINSDLRERKENLPEVCRVFTFPYTALKSDPGYLFSIDLEARKKLPDLIDNSV